MYYTLQQALDILGMPKSSFFDMVKDGRIRSYLPPHRKRGALYDKEQIDAIASIQVATGQAAPNDEKLIFGNSTEADLGQEVAIGLDLFGADDIVPLRLLRQWWMRNPEMFLALKRQDGVLVGYSSVTPMKLETIMKLLRDEIREADIDINDIYPYYVGVPLDCYIASLTVVPGPKQREYATQLINDVAHFILGLGERGVYIQAFYCIGASEEGRRIAHNLGFTEIYTSPSGDRSGYKLLTDDEKSKLARYYMKGYKTSQERAKTPELEDVMMKKPKRRKGTKAG
ncbi:MAG: hypothetical protein H0U76_17635 [Ktedonobacteraceae bacterium]|nr:hypothetical protein [Ktedonobacteraceae bacterium]MBA3823897.1 hypothetical protein [Ktedonobacterales bacterium]